MKTKDEKLTEVVVLTLIGRVNAAIGLTMLLTHSFFGRPEHLTRPLVATIFGALFLAAAASRLNDARYLTGELIRGLGIAAALVAITSIRFYFRRVPHRLSTSESVAAAACTVAFAAVVLWLRRDRKVFSVE